jgi:ribosomal protein L40E
MKLPLLAERITYLSSKVDSGRSKYSEKQELDRLVKEYLELEVKSCRRCYNLRDDHGTTCSKCRKEME